MDKAGGYGPKDWEFESLTRCLKFYTISSVGIEQQPSKLWVIGSSPIWYI